MSTMGFSLYLLFIFSWFLHLTSRVPLLGAMRFDLWLVGILCTVRFFSNRSDTELPGHNCSRKLKYLLITIVCITPFAQFPGSVLRFGIPNFIKAIVFFYFTIWFVDTRRKLMIFVQVYILCQAFRILEPLYLHGTGQYWGSKASMAGWEAMDRLSGSPFDVINPNGLAYVILSVIPFLFVLYRLNGYWKLFVIVAGPLMLYTMMLTGSRSGLLGLIFLTVLIIYKSDNRMLYSIAALVASLILVQFMPNNNVDRYYSIVSSEAKNSLTASGRISGLLTDLKVGLRNPVVGFGLGTSLEANANFGNSAKPAHNIFIEVFQELGLVGLIAFLIFLKSIFSGLLSIDGGTGSKDTGFSSAMRIVLTRYAAITLFFGFASYGLSSYEWYLISGLSVSISYLTTVPNKTEA